MHSSRFAHTARYVALLLAAAFLAACSSRDPALSKPADLVEIKTPIPVRSVWKMDVGSGGNLVLQPAVLENAIYAAAAGGGVVRIAPETGKTVWRTDLDTKISAGVGSDGLTEIGRAHV